MNRALRRLSSETLIYGSSTVVSRFLTFLLVPVYTNLLPTGLYGVHALIYSYVAFGTILFSFGMEAAYFRFAGMKDGGADERGVFSRAFWPLVAWNTLLAAAILALSPTIADYFDPTFAYSRADVLLSVRCTAGILMLDVLAQIPFATLRLENKSVRFSLIKLAAVFVHVAGSFWLIASLHYGMSGVFLANLAGSALALVLLSPVIVRRLRLPREGDSIRELLRFGIPYLPSGLALIALQVIDRPILRAMTSDVDVAVYQANYRLGVAMMVFVAMFEYGWRPFFLQHASDPEAKSLYAKVLTWFTVAAGAIFVGVSLFVGDIARISAFGRHIVPPQYWSGLSIVPVVLGGYIFLGFYTNFLAGIYIEKRTSLLPMITGIGAAANILINLLLIPPLGIMGAAIATLAAYAVMAALMHRQSIRVYRVPYEYGRVATALLAALGCWGAGLLASRAAPDGAAAVLVKLGAWIAYPVLLALLGFFGKRNIGGLLSLARLRGAAS